MSSVLASLRQPLTRSFVVTQNSNVDNNGAYYFTQSDFADWLAANGTKIQTIGSLYIIPGTAAGSTFEDVLRGDGATPLGDSGEYNDRKTLRDLGEQIVIGNGADSRLIVFRLVAPYFPSAYGSDGADVGYVVIENNCTDLAPTNWGRLTVRVARI